MQLEKLDEDDSSMHQIEGIPSVDDEDELPELTGLNRGISSSFHNDLLRDEQDHFIPKPK